MDLYKNLTALSILAAALDIYSFRRQLIMIHPNIYPVLVLAHRNFLFSPSMALCPWPAIREKCE